MERYEQFERDSINSTQAREAYARYLQGFEWDYFATVTFRKDFRDSIKAGQAVFECLSSRIERAFLAVERHRYPNYNCHVHGLIKVPAFRGTHADGTCWDTWAVWKRLYERFGRTTVEEIRSGEDVASYCSKYVVKRLSEYGFYGRQVFWKT